MKKHNYLIWLSVPMMLMTLSAQAHDPAEHEQDAQKPDCAAMNNMDHAKMDMKDPVMQAMMQQCKEPMHDEHETAGEDHANHPQDIGGMQQEKAQPAHQH